MFGWRGARLSKDVGSIHFRLFPSALNVLHTNTPYIITVCTVVVKVVRPNSEGYLYLTSNNRFPFGWQIQRGAFQNDPSSSAKIPETATTANSWD